MEEEDREMDNEENRDPEVPNFAHIGPTVRKKEERKKLLGFDCKECQEYYQGKLEDGILKSFDVATAAGEDVTLNAGFPLTSIITDGSHALAGGKAGFKMWDLSSTLEVLQMLSPNDQATNITCLCSSTDFQTIVSGSCDGSIAVFKG